MSISWRFAPALVDEKDPARLAAIVRRVAVAWSAMVALWSVFSLLALDRRAAAALGAITASGLLLLSQLARRWPAPAAAGLVSWILLVGFVSLYRAAGVLTASGLFTMAIVAAGLLLGVRAAVGASVLIAAGSAFLVYAGESGLLVRSAPPATPWTLWGLAMVGVAAMPVLIREALSRLRRALSDVEAAERRYRLVAENARDLIFVIERDAFSYVSPASRSLLGWTPEELMARGSNFQGFTPDTAQLARATLARAMAEGASHARYEAELLRKDGGSVWCEIEVSLLRDTDGRVRGMIGVTRDISERRRADAEREKIHDELVQAQKMELVGRIAAGVAHDLNNQLTVILGSIDALSDPSLQERADAQKDIADAALSAASLTRQLQLFSRRRAAQHAPFDLARLVRRLEGTLRRVLGPEVRLVVAPSSAPAVVLADEAQIEQVIFNLSVNARDAMPGGGTLTLEVTAGAGLRADAWLLRVTDTGTGIDEATRARVFEPFFTTKPPGRGTGLGLSMVRRIVDEAGGSVSFETELGRGTTFEVALPRHHGPVEREGPPDAGAAASLADATILVVDDAAEVRHLLVRALSADGYRVLEASSPAQALALAAPKQRLDLLVTDVVMPGMRGPDMVKLIRRERPGLQVLYVSGYASEESEIASDPRAALLWKPVSMKTFRRAVRQALEAAARSARGSDGD